MKWRPWLMVGAALALGCEGRPRLGPVSESEQSSSAFLSLSSAKVLELDLTKGAPESAGDGFFPLPPNRTFLGLVRALERAREDQDAKAIFVRLGGDTLGFARSEEVARHLVALREKGKPVVCHAHALDNSGAWLAFRGCDRLWLSPAGELSLVGIAAQTFYLKGLFEKLEIHPDFIAVGKYKSAPESLTRDGPSEPAKESLSAVLRSLRKSWLDALAKSQRKRTGELAETGPWSAEEAKKLGLVDELGYESEALADAKQKAGAERVATTFGTRSSPEGPDLGDLIRILAGADESGAGRPHIAVIPAEGSITMEPGGLLESGGITYKAMSKTLRRLAKDDSTRAVVLRIDSPGGSALASDLIWHELMELKKKKPVIVSVGSMAASGGYYLACPASKIVAEQTSIVGSIGVFGGKIVLGGAFEKYGVDFYTYAPSDKQGAEARAAYLSAVTPWDEATRERMKKTMLDVYDLFLRRVAEGRKMPKDKVHEHAQGRIWTGVQGKERGLVDELGGLGRAIEIARAEAKLDERAPVVLEGPRESLLETLLVGEQAGEAEVQAAVQRVLSRRAAIFGSTPRKLRPFLSAYGPLLGDERKVTAMPFALTIR